MANSFDNMGSDILQAARLAVAMHLKAVAESSQHPGGQRVVIGRAGPQVAGEGTGAVVATDSSKDGRLPPGGDRGGQWAAGWSPFSAEG